MNLSLDLQIACAAVALPTEVQFRAWIVPALVERTTDAELTVRVVDEAESAALNEHYRHKRGSTNILSFPYEPPIPELDTGLLGDLVICAPLVAREALQQGKSTEAHWAHLVIHGILHLQGYDHQEPAEAARMEQLEVRILAGLGYPDPYNDY
ncbi:MAG: rRNA maturation RNase YbeY [Candidatus Competibacterales bacterium]|nr:rRNA maturation RNase YbeY [Candidatus Competibacterales bacterium]